MFSPSTDQAVLNEVTVKLHTAVLITATTYMFSSSHTTHFTKEGGKALRPDGPGRLQQHDICLRPNWLVHRRLKQPVTVSGFITHFDVTYCYTYHRQWKDLYDVRRREAVLA